MGRDEKKMGADKWLGEIKKVATDEKKNEQCIILKSRN